MHAPDTPHNETQRLAALHTLQVLDTPQDTAFERLTQLARDLFDVPIALVSLVDKERQWFKSHLGLDVCETNRAFSFCAHAIAHDAPLMIADTHKDERFADNPWSLTHHVSAFTQATHYGRWMTWPLAPCVSLTKASSVQRT